MRNISVVVVVLFALIFAICSPSFAADKAEKTAIVLASFGTSYPGALKAIINIEEKVKKEFPGVTVKHAFTSNIIRKIWHKRQGDKKFLAENKSVSSDFLYVQGPLATLANLQDEGYRTIIVQPTHIFAGEMYADLSSYVDGLNSIKTYKKNFMPFKKLVIGRPALGKPGIENPYHEDLETAARALKVDADRAAEKGGALVYMGHGNDYYSTGIYVEFQAVMNKMYPGVKTLVGCVEGFPSEADVMNGLKRMGIKKVILKPFMVVAGDHAKNDMASDEEDSWKTAITKMGIQVDTDLTGLAENDKWAAIYTDLIADVVKDNDIKL